jgi:hypothetical protein
MKKKFQDQEQDNIKPSRRKGKKVKTMDKYQTKCGDCGTAIHRYDAIYEFGCQCENCYMDSQGLGQLKGNK